MAHGLFVTHDILSLVGRQEVDVRIGCGNHILKGNSIGCQVHCDDLKARGSQGKALPLHHEFFIFVISVHGP